MSPQELGALNHVGQTEYEAGLGAGERMGEAGVTNAICVNQEVGNAALDLRCKGFADGLTKSGGTVDGARGRPDRSDRIASRRSAPR